MSVNVNKQGQLQHNTFIEIGSQYNNITSFSYTPSTGNNSCINNCIINLSQFVGLNAPIQLAIELDLTWTNFTGYGTNGTFFATFQGANRKIETNTFVWEGYNYIAKALGTFTTKITNALTGGTYHYNVTATIPASWFNTYNASYLGIRSDYSNGTGQITVSNIQVSLLGGTQNTSSIASITNNYIKANNFYEY